jgi:hypothetical protein
MRVTGFDNLRRRLAYVLSEWLSASGLAEGRCTGLFDACMQYVVQLFESSASLYVLLCSFFSLSNTSPILNGELRLIIGIWLHYAHGEASVGGGDVPSLIDTA